MDRAELRLATKRLAEKAEQASGRPTLTDVAEARQLYDARHEILSTQIRSNVKVIFPETELDWSSWPSIATFFRAYYLAIVDLDNKISASLAQKRWS